MKRHLSMMLASIVLLGTTASYASSASNQPSAQVQEETTKQEQALNAEGPTGDGLNNILTMAVAWKQTAAEYKALYHQAYNMARLQVDLALANHKPGDKPLAVITDLDDTIIIPVNYWGYLINKNKDFFDDAIWDRWIPQNKMVAAPGALEFFTYCKEKGVEVYYVSNRDQGANTYKYAMTQLQILKFPYVDNTHLTVNRDTSNKETRQNEVAQKYNVISYLGDNLNDFRRVYYVKDVDERAKLMEQDKALYGSKFILMPNPTDGHWVRAIFGDSEPPATDENREIWKKAATRSAFEDLFKASYHVNINGSELQSDQKPINVNGRIFVPLRDIFESLGAEIEWNTTSQTVIATKDTIKVILQIGNKIATINGEQKELEVPAKMINGRTMVPTRFVSESLGAKVDWDAMTNTVLIKSQ